MGEKVTAGRNKRLRRDIRTVKIQLYPLRVTQFAIEAASEIRNAEIEILGAEVRGERTDGRRGFYALRLRVYYRVGALAVIEPGVAVQVGGLAIFHRSFVLASNQNKHSQAAAVLELDYPALLSAGMEGRNGAEHYEGVKNLPPDLLDYFGNDLCFGREGRSVWITMKQKIRIRIGAEHVHTRKGKK